jgi:Lar family restriction alleviation protein
MSKSNKKTGVIKLKPCPFCGSENTRKGNTEGITGKIWWVACEICGASTGLKSQAIEATAAWNLRIPEVANRETGWT